jgi:hypothetical protein
LAGKYFGKKEIVLVAVKRQHNNNKIIGVNASLNILGEKFIEGF